jgi:uncharacterized protein (DUF924 family)
MENNAALAWIDAVNHFWFHELKPTDWFSGRPEIDLRVRAVFAELRAELKRNPPAADSLSAAGHVAAIIVFDQFSRNLFRDSAEAYATDQIALLLAKHAIDRGLDSQLDLNQRHFLYMPFMHSEDRAEQARSLELFAKLNSADIFSYAKRHKEIIDRFGRYPHRNKVLARTSTPEEEEFLRTEATPY